MRTAAQAAVLAREIAARPALHLVGMMAYEGQIAGVTDAARGPHGAAVRTMKRLSRPDVARRRAEAVAAAHGFTQVRHTVEMDGLCTDCSSVRT